MSFKSTTKILKENQHIFYTQIIDKLFFFLFGVVLARSLDLESYGNIILVFTFTNLMVTLFSFGLPIYLQRETAFSENNTEKLFTITFSINLLLTLPAVIFSIVFFVLIYPALSVYMIVLLSILVALSSNETLLMSLLKGLKKYKKIFIITLIIRTLVITFILLLWMNGFNSSAIIITFLTGNLLILLSIFFVSKQYFDVIYLNEVKLKNIKNLFVIVSPLWLAVLFNFLYDRIDFFVISKIVSIEHLSFYGISYGVLKSSTMAFNFLLIGGLTKAASFSSSKRGLKLFIVKYSELMLVISVILFLLMFFSAKDIIVLLYTEKYLNSVLILQILSFAIIPLALNNLTGTVLNGLGLYKQNMYVTIIGFMFNITANIFVIPVYGIIGAAYITIITELIILLGDIYFLKLKQMI